MRLFHKSPSIILMITMEIVVHIKVNLTPKPHGSGSGSHRFPRRSSRMLAWRVTGKKGNRSPSRTQGQRHPQHRNLMEGAVLSKLVVRLSDVWTEIRQGGVPSTRTVRTGSTSPQP